MKNNEQGIKDYQISNKYSFHQFLVPIMDHRYLKTVQYNPNNKKQRNFLPSLVQKEIFSSASGYETSQNKSIRLFQTKKSNCTLTQFNSSKQTLNNLVNYEEFTSTLYQSKVILQENQNKSTKQLNNSSTNNNLINSNSEPHLTKVQLQSINKLKINLENSIDSESENSLILTNLYGLKKNDQETFAKPFVRSNKFNPKKYQNKFEKQEVSLEDSKHQDSIKQSVDGDLLQTFNSIQNTSYSAQKLNQTYFPNPFNKCFKIIENGETKRDFYSQSPLGGQLSQKTITMKGLPIQQSKIEICEQQLPRGFFKLTDNLKKIEKNNELIFQEKLEYFFLQQKQNEIYKMKTFIQTNKQRKLRKNLKDKQDQLNKIIAVISQPSHKNPFIKKCHAEEQFLPRKISESDVESNSTSIKKDYGRDEIYSQEIQEFEQNYKMIASEGKGKPSMKQIRKSLRNTLLKLKRLRINPRELLTQDVFSQKPFQKPGSYEFIQASKQNDLQGVKEALQRNRFLVYDFDHAYLSALHWAAKRGYFEIAKFLVENGADPNALDLIGRNCLYLSASFNQIEILQLLLFHQADPWSTPSMKYNNIVKKNPLIHRYLTNSRKIHILLRMTPPYQRDTIWKKEALSLFIDLDQ